MKIEDIKPDALKTVDDNELYVLRLRAINLYERHFYNSRCIRIGKLERSTLLDNYQHLTNEMKHRGLRYNEKAIDRAVFRKAMFGIDVRDLGDLVVVANYMSIAGSFVKDPAGAEDVDIVIRDNTDNRDQGIELKVSRTVKMRTGKEAHFVYAPRGPNSTYVPMFDLVLRGKGKMERVPVEEKRAWSKAADKPPEYYEKMDSWDQQLLEDNWNVVQNLADGSVLDLGCGTGRLLKMLEQSGRKVAGVDNDRTALRYCRKRGLDVVDVDLEKDPLPYDSNSWDNVTMVHSLEHIKNTEHLLREAERVAAERVLALVPLADRHDPTHAHAFKTTEILKSQLGGDSRYTVHEIERASCALAIRDKKAVAKAEKPAERGTMRGIYLPKDTAQDIIAGKAKEILLPDKLSTGYVAKDIYLVADKNVLGVIKLSYAGREAFKAKYSCDVVERFDPPVAYDPPPGTELKIREIVLDKARYECECIDCGHELTTDQHCKDIECPECGGTMRRKDRPGPGQVAKQDEGTSGAEGNIDFEPGTKGTGVLQAHIMGIEEEQVKSLKDAQNRILVARFTAEKLERALKDVLGEKGVHCDIRLSPSGKDYWEGGEILVGNLSGLSKLEKLETENARLRFSWKVSHKGDKQQNVVRGPMSWIEAGKKSIAIFEPGSVGASAHKYAALINLDTFKWEIYKADKHAKKIRLTGGRFLDGNFLFGYVPVGEGERVWMMSRLSNDDHKELTKASATAPQTCKYCDKPATKSHLWADGRAYIPVCDEHSMKAIADIKAQGDRVTRTVKIEQPLRKGLQLEFRILKQIKTKQIVGGVVYEPDVVDTQGDYTSAQDIQEAMYRFMEKYAKDSKRIKVQHRGKSYTFPILECFQPEHDITRGGQTVKKGAWWLMLKITEPGVWNLIQDGHITAFSMGGMASAG